MTQKRKIEDLQADLLDKQKEREDLEAKNRIEAKLYYQNITYIMLKEQDENVELQKDAQISLKQFEDMHRVKEKDYKYDVQQGHIGGGKVDQGRQEGHTDPLHAQRRGLQIALRRLRVRKTSSRVKNAAKSILGKGEIVRNGPRTVN